MRFKVFKIFILQRHSSKGVQKNMHEILLKIKSVTDALIIIYGNFSEKILKNTNVHILLIVVLLI